MVDPVAEYYRLLVASLGPGPSNDAREIGFFRCLSFVYLENQKVGRMGWRFVFVAFSDL